MADRVGIFIDGPNLYGGARRLTGDGRLDIPALVSWIATDRRLRRCPSGPVSSTRA